MHCLFARFATSDGFTIMRKLTETRIYEFVESFLLQC